MASLLNELNNNLATARELGDTEWVARLEKRIKAEEKAAAAAEPESEPEPAPKRATAKKGN